MKNILLFLLPLIGCSSKEQTGKPMTSLETFGTFSNHYFKATTTRCVEWEKDDSVGGYLRTNTFEFIITPDLLILDTVIYNGEKIAMWADPLQNHAMDDGDSCRVISFWPYQMDHEGKVIPHPVNYNYSYYITLWLRNGLHHISIGGKSPIRNRHTVYLN